MIAMGFINLPGGMEWIIIAVILICLFAPKEGPKILGSITKTFRDIRGAKDEITDSFHNEVNGLLDDSDEPKKKRKRAARPKS